MLPILSLGLHPATENIPAYLNPGLILILSGDEYNEPMKVDVG
jgi:hypothetical protein